MPPKTALVFYFGEIFGLVGFTQLYPSFSSVSMKKIWILNDLFVEETSRRKGSANLLMNTVENYARETGAVRMVLATAVRNDVYD